ncbi:TonB-dependent receptor [Novosphingobium sp. FKTRR1]|uniref:TonB-dependent receptor n=1 Tax=unclassified Novosphingobium TaxID=2644732 RepID=UPI001CF02926|nr:TonB-dependent receptor [Novosphingobium sp. FKTRR1]
MKHDLVRALLVGSSLLASTAAMAQGAATPASTPANDGQQGIQEIVVTATRAETSAQKTAIALTVYTGADLAAKGISNVQSLAAIDPSVNVTTSSGAAYVAVRGIASTDVTEIGDPSVPIARDGFYTNRAFAIGTSLYDVARVEVLKGPQGTLNGRNSTGGLVSVITNRPGKTSAMQASLEGGGYRALNAEVAANVPVSDKIQFRVSGIHRQHDGYRTLTGVSGRGDDEYLNSGRIQVAIQPVESLKLWASYQHDEIDDVGDVSMTSDLGTRPSFGDARSFANVAATSTRTRADRFRWEASLADLPGDLTLVYAGGYDKSSWKHRLDATGPVYPAIRQFIQSEAPTTWNHEVRLSNSVNNPLFFQVGYFHFEEANTIDSGLFNVVMTGPFAPGGPLAFLGQAGKYGIKFDYNVKTKSDAVFGQVAYALNEQFKLTVGGRYTWDKKVRTGQSFLTIPALSSPFAPPIAFPVVGNGNLSHGEPTFHIGLDYSPSSATLVYAKFDRGYKSGGFNSNGSAASLPYGPEKLNAFEIGTKNRFLGNRLQVNAAAFYFDYKGYQASQTSAALGGGDGIFNVGSAKIYGAELQTIALFGQGGRIDLNAAYLHTKFADGISVRDGGGTTRSIGGNRLPNAPSLSASAGLEYAIGVGSGKLTPRIDGKYSSQFNYSVFNDADTRSNAFVTGNASVTYEPEGGQWQLQAFVRNFTDKVVLANAARNFVAGLNTYQFQPPRTWGVRGSVKF